MADQPLCKIDGCGKGGKITRGWCSAHYQRWRAHNNPLGGGTSPGAPLAWIETVALKHTGDECLIWRFASYGNGYGTISIDGRLTPAHRYICELVHGAPPPEHDAAHECGKGHLGCVNPRHLSWKTHAENMADTIKHGTHNRGDRNGTSKLTEPDIHEIRRLLAAGWTHLAIAEMFGVSQRAISMIASGKRWGWLARQELAAKDQPAEVAA